MMRNVNEVRIEVKFLSESFAWDLLGNNAKHRTLWTAEHNNMIIVLSSVMYNKTHQLNFLQK